MAKQILKICIPMGFQYSFIYSSASILQWVINGYGTSVIGAFTATSQIENLIQQPFTALGTAMATYTGQILRYLLNGAGDSAYAMINGIVEIICRLVFVFLLTNTNPGKHWFSGAFLYVIICSYFCAILLLNSQQINPDWRDCGEKMFEIFQVYFYISLRQIVHSTDQHGHGLTRSCPSNREDR